MSNRLVAVLLLALPAAAAAGPRASSTSALASRALALAPLPADSEAYRAPSRAQQNAFGAALVELLGAPKRATAERDLRQLGFRVRWLPGPGKQARWALVEETGPARTGAGTFLFNLAPARDLWLEAPHADSDLGTGAQGVRLLEALGARALLLNGANRCASAELTPCSGSTRVCGGALRSSDPAHALPTWFMAAHEALRQLHPTALAVSLHGEADPAADDPGRVQALVSDGTDDPRAGALSVQVAERLGAALSARGGSAFSCNAEDGERGGMRKLCGTTNVQGRADNGSGEACSLEAPTSSGRFLHLEQSPALRRLEAAGDAALSPVAAALAGLVPCTLPGPGEACPRPEAAAGTP